MAKLFRVLAVLAVMIIGFGFYRGWFAVTGDNETEDHHIDVKLSVDTEKFEHDADAVAESVSGKDLNRT